MTKKSYRIVLGEQLRAIRKEMGLSAYIVAKKGNIRIDQVNSVESGDKNYTIDAFLGYIYGTGLFNDFKELIRCGIKYSSMHNQ